MLYDVVIRSTGRYLPERVFTNKEFEAILDTSDEWIVERTGIRERRMAAPGENNSDMGLAAAQQCLARVGMDPLDVELIVVPTVTPDTVFPATGNTIQGKLGASRAWSFDVNAGCSGFVYALSVAVGLLASGQARNCLLIGTEKMTSIADFTDRSTCVLFGDAAGCLLLEAVEPQNNPQGYGIRDFALGTDGTIVEALWQPDGGSSRPPSHQTVARRGHFVTMAGREVYKHAVRRMEQSISDLLAKVGQRPEDIRWFVPHQANARIIETIQQRMGLPADRFYVNIQRYGNTTSATIPVCLDELNESGQIKPGDKLVMFTFGTGLTWGSSYTVWGAP